MRKRETPTPSPPILSLKLLDKRPINQPDQSELAKRLAVDWQARFATEPLLLETLVDGSRFAGTCYRAANWIELGDTTGRGRMDRAHARHGQAPKRVLVYPLVADAQRRLVQA